MNAQIKPLFKYIGGKTWLASSLREQLQSALIQAPHIDTYVEPFSGGLGAFFSLASDLEKHGVKNVELSDINPHLIFTYQSIKNHPQDFQTTLLKLEDAFSFTRIDGWKNTDKQTLKKNLKSANAYFSKIKADFNQHIKTTSITQAARFVFLQKHAFNGIYRENLKGEYNTPFNWSGQTHQEELKNRLQEISELFKKFNLSFKCQSFEQCEYSRKNAIFYLDPPYLNQDNQENRYHKDSFDLAKQIQLIETLKESHFIYSNHADPRLKTALQKLHPQTTLEIGRKNFMSADKQTRHQERQEILVLRLHKPEAGPSTPNNKT
jgi:DNA adenine methylase